jgi:hypothetical protein
MHDTIQTEEQLVARAQRALSHCNWEIGECAAQWTQRYARGRTDADFGALVGLSGDQVYQRRRVWETFGDVRENYARLKWSHFYAALNWNDAADCLAWAEEMEATVAEMKAWRRAQHGEDLTAPPEPEEFQAGGIELVPFEPSVVQDPDTFGRGTARDRSGMAGGQPRELAAVSGAARESGQADDYAPFGKRARGPAPGGETAVEDRSAPSAEQVLKRLASTLERCNAALTPEVLEEFHHVPVALRQRLLSALEDLTAKTAGLKV